MPSIILSEEKGWIRVWSSSARVGPQYRGGRANHPATPSHEAGCGHIALPSRNRTGAHIRLFHGPSTPALSFASVALRFSSDSGARAEPSYAGVAKSSTTFSL